MTPVEALPIGVCSWSLQVNNVADLADRMQRLNVQHVQISCGDPVHGSWVEDEQIVSAVRATKLKLTGAMLAFPGEDYSTPETIKQTGGFGPVHLRLERLQRLKWGLNRTRQFALQDLSFHAGFIPSVDSENRRDFMDTLAQVGRMAADFDIIIGLETGQETAELLKLTLDELAIPTLMVNFDPANMLLYDRGDPLKAVELLAPYIRRVHAKDAIRPTRKGEWGREVPLGTGEVDIGAFVQRLWQVGYRGPLCIEREVGTQQQRFDDIAVGVSVIRQAIESLG